jgi:hypothetical protein
MILRLENFGSDFFDDSLDEDVADGGEPSGG